MNPNLSHLFTYKSRWSLCTINKNGKLRVTHFASCMVTGRAPLWSVWTVNGRWDRFYSGRDEITKAYPGHVWRRVMARWGLVDDTDMDAKQRREALAKEMKSPLPEPPNEGKISGGIRKTPESQHNGDQKLH